MQLVFFGANDAALDGTLQHVPLDEYRVNLKAIAQHPTVTAHKPTRLIFVTPPPLNEYAANITSLQRGFALPQRTAEHTQKYAHACVQVGQEIGVPVVDLWGTMMAQAGWKPGMPLAGSKRVPENEYLKRVLLDGIGSIAYLRPVSTDRLGLHLGPEGYRVLFRQTMATIARNYPRQTPEALDNVFPPWAVASR